MVLLAQIQNRSTNPRLRVHPSVLSAWPPSLSASRSSWSVLFPFSKENTGRRQPPVGVSIFIKIYLAYSVLVVEVPTSKQKWQVWGPSPLDSLVLGFVCFCNFIFLQVHQRNPVWKENKKRLNGSQQGSLSEPLWPGPAARLPSCPASSHRCPQNTESVYQTWSLGVRPPWESPGREVGQGLVPMVANGGVVSANPRRLGTPCINSGTIPSACRWLKAAPLSSSSLPRAKAAHPLQNGQGHGAAHFNPLLSCSSETGAWGP